MIERNLSRTVTVTARTYPHVCGVGDYTINLVRYSKKFLEIDLSLITGADSQSIDDEVSLFPILTGNSQSDYEKLFDLLTRESVKTLILQYAPYLYNSRGYDFNLVNFWNQCSRVMNTVLIVHETYYWFIRHPGTWFKGVIQAYALKSLALSSSHIFCGSEQYSRQLQRLVQDRKQIHYLPIPNNIAPHIISSEEKLNLRQSLNIPPNNLLLVLYGCIGSIRKPWVVKLDRYLHSCAWPITWLLLGNAQSLKISFENPLICPGYLSADNLSQYLQISDLLMMPHEFGVSAKRGSFMSAIEHKLPVVGTSGMLTDSFLREQPSIFLTPDGMYNEFRLKLIEVIQMQSSLADLTRKTYLYYQENLSWKNVVNRLNTYI